MSPALRKISFSPMADQVPQISKWNKMRGKTLKVNA